MSQIMSLWFAHLKIDTGPIQKDIPVEMPPLSFHRASFHVFPCVLLAQQLAWRVLHYHLDTQRR